MLPTYGTLHSLITNSTSQNVVVVNLYIYKLLLCKTRDGTFNASSIGEKQTDQR